MATRKRQKRCQIALSANADAIQTNALVDAVKKSLVLIREKLALGINN